MANRLGDLATTLRWLPTTELEIVPSSGELWSHVLVDLADNSEVRVIAANENWPAEAIHKMLKDDHT
jgi:hypothetical protein